MARVSTCLNRPIHRFDALARRRLRGALLLLCAAGLAACTSQQWYGAGQGWQRLECNKMADTAERNRCMASAATSYDEYRRQSEAARAPK